jgi:hypothetical protein
MFREKNNYYMKKIFVLIFVFIAIKSHAQERGILDDYGDIKFYVAGGVGYNGRPCVNIEIGGTGVIPNWFLSVIVHSWTMGHPGLKYRTLVGEAGIRLYVIPVKSVRNPFMVFGEYKTFLDNAPGNPDPIKEILTFMPAAGISYAHMIKFTGHAKHDVRIEFAKTFDKRLGFYSVSAFFALTL